MIHRILGEQTSFSKRGSQTIQMVYFLPSALLFEHMTENRRPKRPISVKYGQQPENDNFLALNGPSLGTDTSTSRYIGPWFRIY